MKAFAVAVLVMLTGSAVAQSAQGDPTAVAQVSPELKKSQAVLRAMTKAYEYYIAMGDSVRANNYLRSIVAYTKFQSSKLDITPEHLFLTAGVGTKQTWAFMQRQAIELPPVAATDDSGKPSVTDCYSFIPNEVRCETRPE